MTIIDTDNLQLLSHLRRESRAILEKIAVTEIGAEFQGFLGRYVINDLL